MLKGKREVRLQIQMWPLSSLLLLFLIGAQYMRKTPDSVEHFGMRVFDIIGTYKWHLRVTPFSITDAIELKAFSTLCSEFKLKTIRFLTHRALLWSMVFSYSFIFPTRRNFLFPYQKYFIYFFTLGNKILWSKAYQNILFLFSNFFTRKLMQRIYNSGVKIVRTCGLYLINIFVSTTYITLIVKFYYCLGYRSVASTT